MLEDEDNQSKSKSPFDAYIQVGYHLFAIHRNVLMALSMYFQILFSNYWIENQQKIINFNDIESCAMEEIINYAYTGEINITNENILSLWIAVDCFLIFNLRDECVNFLINQIKNKIKVKRHDNLNSIFRRIFDIRSYADSMGSSRLVYVCDNYIGCHFEQFLISKEFIHLNLYQFLSMIESDDLITQTEEIIFEACKEWIRLKEIEDKIELTPQVFSKVRWQLLSVNFIQNEVLNYELIRSSQFCQNLIDEMMKEIKYQFLLKCSRPRNFGDVGQIYVIGGDKTHGKMEIYNVVTGGWREEQRMPTTMKSGMGIAVLNDEIYILGGHYYNIACSSVEIYNTKTGTWSFGHELLSKRGLGAATVLNGCIYVCGGWRENEYLNTVECYNPMEEKWTKVASMTTCRAFSAAVTLGGLIYALGGRDENGLTLNSVECYDPINNIWKKVRPMKHKRQGLAAAVLKGKLYACGGHNGSRVLKSVEMYDPFEDKWKKVNSMIWERDGLAVVANFGKLWAIGGNSYGSSSDISSSVEIYHPESNQWVFGQWMAEPRRFHVAAVIS